MTQTRKNIKNPTAIKKNMRLGYHPLILFLVIFATDSVSKMLHRNVSSIFRRWSTHPGRTKQCRSSASSHNERFITMAIVCDSDTSCIQNIQKKLHRAFGFYVIGISADLNVLVVYLFL